GVTERRGINWLEDQLDQWARDSQKALLVANTTWRIIPSDRSARRLQLLIETDLLPGSFLGNLAAGFWARDISTEVLHDLIKAASKDKSLAAISGRLAVLDQYIEKYGNQMPILQSLIYQALEEGTGLTLTVMDSFHWKRLAERVSEDNPLLVARLCVMAATGEHHHRSNDIREVLQQVIVSGGWQVFEQIVGPAIIENPLLLWRLDSPFAGRNLLSSLDAKDLVAWIEKDVETRLHLIAHAVPIGDQPLSNLARALLVRWGDRDDVRSALAATFGSGHWSGPEGNWLAQKLKQIEGWMTDPNPNVRAWAIELADYYRRRIERAKLLEEEER
ncbi:MAG TPA: hypothetical protein VEC96_17260, partial [Anaerolineae bacterium]|nr:hypothetical protein [Anaerolineae bacterium]